MSDPKTARTALLSVFDKTGLVPFAAGLRALGFRILSTGGTARALREGGVELTEVSEATGAPEMLEGRVKTLHPRIHAGILYRRDRDDDLRELEAQGIAPIDLVCVNLYAFEDARARGERDPGALRELIDIGGPTLLRASAKAWPWVLSVSDPADYDGVLAALREGEPPEALRRRLAAKAFARTAAYDAAIASWVGEGREQDALLPPSLAVSLERVDLLRYGENPHQRAALYRPRGERRGLGSARVLSGKALSYNNLLDVDAALALARDLASLGLGASAACVIKHATPCGAEVADAAADAFRGAHAGDPVSAFGGIVAVLPRIDKEAALAMTEEGLFLECIVAGAFDEDAVDILTTRPRWGKNVRLVEVGDDPPAAFEASEEVALRSLAGAVLVATRDENAIGSETLEPRTSRIPTPAEARDARIAIACAKHARSNAIAIVRGGRLVGIGGGQPSRVGAVDLALAQAGEQAKGATLASDAFFPFPDSVERATAAGITCVVEPGGSKKDDEVIAVAEQAGIALAFTSVRHFRH